MGEVANVLGAYWQPDDAIDANSTIDAAKCSVPQTPYRKPSTGIWSPMV
ncbi:predicted protein [Plenodomus lingam JN3]|uniref:Predicted protein n=1 Tax=Leptosphaeria maculans (strain JN3 / isolate v23.1.3 / race Av1-4-5-6-7-8) TaxID=985895 RepID=E4ZUP8_LEPMJ|nr:predicted protein [Plenodomus lingam JN3]CBX95127.1 predicted protein [Plenodomus lingam JN3]